MTVEFVGQVHRSKNRNVSKMLRHHDPHAKKPQTLERGIIAEKQHCQGDFKVTYTKRSDDPHTASRTEP